MKTRSIVAAALLCGTFAAGIGHAQPADTASPQSQAVAAGQGLIGTPGPRLHLETIDGESIDLGSLYGMNDPIEDVRRFRDEYGIHMPIVIDDGRLGAALNLQVAPQHVVIGRDGRIRYVGHLADEALDAALAAARSIDRQPASEADGAVPAIARYRVGDRLPSMAATTIDGAVFAARSPGERRPTVLVFFSPWCESYLAGTSPEVSSSCRQVREQVDALAKEHADVRSRGATRRFFDAGRGGASVPQTVIKVLPPTLKRSPAARKFCALYSPFVNFSTGVGRKTATTHST